ncbi:MAG: hypothetical protein QME59_04355 [Candidatus Hydrothermarchaeota archaeon]|nr:hypothetical protein [Candidatus Hydrothermarchaeota archaeon]
MREFARRDEAQVILCPGKSRGSIENYVLMHVWGEGLIVIKQEILVDAGEGKNAKLRS